MISNFENLASALRAPSSPEDDAAELLTEKIKSDPRIQAELTETGQARVKDATGRCFVVRRTATAGK